MVRAQPSPRAGSARGRVAGVPGVSLALAVLVFAFVQMNELVHELDTTRLIEKLASLQPGFLACMHGSAWRGDGAAMLRSLSLSLAQH